MRWPWQRVVVRNADGSRMSFPDAASAAEFLERVKGGAGSPAPDQPLGTAENHATAAETVRVRLTAPGLPQDAPVLRLVDRDRREG